jgi:hypothetical protein
MPLRYEIVAAERHVRIEGRGSVTMPGMIAVVERVAADPGFKPEFTVVFDLREASYAADLQDGDALAAILRQKKSDFRSRFAVVVPESLHFLAKLYCQLANIAGFDRIRCFTAMEEARQWCRGSP